MTAKHEPTDEQRGQVEAMSAYGIPQADIARIMSIDPKTLRAHYRDQLDLGASKANAKIAETMYNKALNGDTACLIFWTKARMGWSEKIRIEDETKPEEQPDYSRLSDDELRTLEALRRKATGERSSKVH